MNSKLLFLITLVHVACSTVTYDNDQVWRIFADVTRKADIQAFINDLNLDVWSARFDSIDIQVTPGASTAVHESLQKLGLTYKILIENIQEIIDNQEISRLHRQQPQQSAKIDVSSYHDIDEIYAYIDELAAEYDYVTVETIGQSFEQRDMKMVKVSTQADNPTAMWLHCGAHAREWVSPATCLFGLAHFTDNYGIDSDVTSFLDSSDIYMVVVVNPDGYNYSWTDDRMWRKNRRVIEGSACFGVDLNRNYDDGLSWGLDGSSPTPCVDTFHGDSGFSEPELVAIRDKIHQIQESQTIKSFYDIHSYSNLWLHAYAFLPDEAEFFNEMNSTAAAGSSAMTDLYGTVITYGPHYSTIYQASGTSLDWAYGRGIIHSYILELRDNGEFGFLLPEDQIVPTAQECWTGIFAADKQM